MPDPLETLQVGNEEFSSPEHAVDPEAKSIEGHAEHWLGPTVLGEAGGHVSMVVLDCPRLDVEIESELRGEVFRVQVMDDDVWLDPIEVTQVARRLQEGLIAGEMLEVANVVARYQCRPLGDRHGVLQLRTDRQHLPPRLAG
jgi:hypothetical protein